MKKIALATAALLVATGGAFAQSSLNTNASDRPTVQKEFVTGSSFGASANIPVAAGAVVVAPSYSDNGYLPTDIAGKRSQAIAPSHATGVAVAPSYSSSGHLPGDRY